MIRRQRRGTPWADILQLPRPTRIIQCSVQYLHNKPALSMRAKSNTFLRLIILGAFLIHAQAQLRHNADPEASACPDHCKCWEEHWADRPIAQRIKLLRQLDNADTDSSHTRSDNHHTSNNVFYDPEEDVADNPLVKVATCLMPSDVDGDTLEQFIARIPSDIEALTLMEAVGAPNATLHSHYFIRFDDLVSLEIHGLQFSVEKQCVASRLTFSLDGPLRNLKYLSLNNVALVASPPSPLTNKYNMIINNQEINQDETINVLNVQGQEEILPYNVYVSKQKEQQIPSFVGHDNLLLLQIRLCNLQSIHWHMFDGLKNLQYLLLEDNHLKFIPDFAFYGVPNLKSLSLARNSLLNIQITDLAGLLELEYLDMSYNNFSQLSELSFPPFPKLKLADFQNNPITAIFPNTFEIMNTTEGLKVGCKDISLQLLPNSFLGLGKLKELTLTNIGVSILRRDFFNGLARLKQLTMTGSIQDIEFDAFAELEKLETLVLSACNITTISMDAFFGLTYLQVLDLSRNNISIIAPGTFDQQLYLKELYLNDNEITTLPIGLFAAMRNAKLIRLNNNPWFCSCDMSDWNPKVINKVKNSNFVQCDKTHDKGNSCVFKKYYKYEYDNRVAPKCVSPQKYKNTGVFQILRKYLRCNRVHSYKTKILKPNLLPTSQIHKHFNISKNIHAITYDKYNVLSMNQNKKELHLENNLNPLIISMTQLDSATNSKKQQHVLNKKYQHHNLRILGKLRKLQKDKKY